jgi:replicative DNA helicase
MDKTSAPYGAKVYSDVLKEGIRYIEDRREGRIKSFRTPWAGFNRAGIGGLEWGSMLTIGARPGSGKTMIVSQILKESRVHNPDQDFSILEFQFEMGDKQYAARQFAAEVGLDYNSVLSTDRQLDEFAYKMMKQHLSDTEQLERQGVQRKLIKKPLDHQQMEKAIRYYYTEMGSKPMIVTIDHSWLIKKTAEEREKIQTLYNTSEMLMQLKNELPVLILMITQMNRTMEEASRIHPGNIGNYPTSSDIFGGDALMQASDMVVVLNRPYKYNLTSYGPKKYVAASENIFMHLVKVRNAADDTNMLFMQAQFNKQRMVEIPEPMSNQDNGYQQWKNQKGSGRQLPLGAKEEL